MEEGDHRRSRSSGNNERLHKKLVLFLSHLSDGKSSTGMEISILWQLGELLESAVGVVPATLAVLDIRICWML